MIPLKRRTNAPAARVYAPASDSCSEPASLYAESPDEDSAQGRPPPRLLDQLRDRLRVKHYSIRTEDAYLDWVRRYIRFHNKQHPRNLGANALEKFLTHLAVDR